MRLIERFIAIFDRTIDVLVLITAAILTLMTFMVGVSIFARYVLNSPLGWVPEVEEYCLVFMGFLAAAWILRDEKHIHIDIVLNSVSPRTKNIMNTITSVICAIICLILTWFTFKVTLDLYQTNFLINSTLMPPKFIFIAGMFLGVLMLFLQLVKRTCILLVKWKTPSNPTIFEKKDKNQ
jgi:C4-dicarboxylate transporter, DctQ subunit